MIISYDIEYFPLNYHELEAGNIRKERMSIRIFHTATFSSFNWVLFLESSKNTIVKIKQFYFANEGADGTGHSHRTAPAGLRIPPAICCTPHPTPRIPRPNSFQVGLFAAQPPSHGRRQMSQRELEQTSCSASRSMIVERQQWECCWPLSSAGELELRCRVADDVRILM